VVPACGRLGGGEPVVKPVISGRFLGFPGGQRVRSYMPMIIASCIINALPVISLAKPEVDQGISRKQQLNTALVYQ